MNEWTMNSSLRRVEVDWKVDEEEFEKCKKYFGYRSIATFGWFVKALGPGSGVKLKCDFWLGLQLKVL